MEGQRTSDAPQDPQFSTWEEVINRIKGGSSNGSSSEGSGNGSGSGSDGAGAGNGGGSGRVAETAYYTLLGVEPTATQAELKSAYRKLALQLHPDVSSAPDASERFAAVAAAYDVLSDPESRVLYDRYGADGMRGKLGGAPELLLSALSLSEGAAWKECTELQHAAHAAGRANRKPATSCISMRFTPPRPLFGFLRCAGASAGSGNASREWTEFKRYKRQNKHTQARDASTASYSSSVDEAWAGDAASGAAAGTSGSAGAAASSSGSSGEDPRWAGMPTAGQVVEYPLSQQQKDELQDGRTHGVGLLVGRNCDR